jgi:hypothetical protein
MEYVHHENPLLAPVQVHDDDQDELIAQPEFGGVMPLGFGDHVEEQHGGLLDDLLGEEDDEIFLPEHGVIGGAVEDEGPPYAVDVTDMNWGTRTFLPGTHASNSVAYATRRRRVEQESIDQALRLLFQVPELRPVIAHVDFLDHLMPLIGDEPSIDFDTVRNATLLIAQSEGDGVPTLNEFPALIDGTDPERVASMSQHMMGQLEWRQPAESQFAQAVVAGTLDALPSNARMNCWESIIFAAYRVGVVGLARLQTIYTADGTDEQALQQLIGADRANPVWIPGQDAALLGPVPAGSVVFVRSNGVQMWHVVISLGGTTLADTRVMSLYHLGTGGVLGEMTLDEYVGTPNVDSLEACTDPFV